jgi:hypothetical protein
MIDELARQRNMLLLTLACHCLHRTMVEIVIDAAEENPDADDFE